jgi:hypothetical protein
MNVSSTMLSCDFSKFALRIVSRPFASEDDTVHELLGTPSLDAKSLTTKDSAVCLWGWASLLGPVFVSSQVWFNEDFD